MLWREMPPFASGKFAGSGLPTRLPEMPPGLSSAPDRKKNWHFSFTFGDNLGKLRDRMNDDTPANSTENLIVLLTGHQGRLFRYIFSLVPSEADAKDILQETSLALFRKFDQYDVTRPFLPWAYRFAYLEVQKHREKSGRAPLLFSEDIIDLLANERERHEARLDERLHLLDFCLKKLSPADRDLLTSRYARRESAEEMMARFSLSRRTLFRNLEMLRQRLHDCVSQQLKAEGLA